MKLHQLSLYKVFMELYNDLKQGEANCHFLEPNN